MENKKKKNLIKNQILKIKDDLTEKRKIIIKMKIKRNKNKQKNKEQKINKNNKQQINKKSFK